MTQEKSDVFPKALPENMVTVPAEAMLQFFTYQHLSPKLMEASLPFCKLAEYIVEKLPRNPQRTTALRKLLEAKDCAVRAVLFK